MLQYTGVIITKNVAIISCKGMSPVRSLALAHACIGLATLSRNHKFSYNFSSCSTTCTHICMYVFMVTYTVLVFQGSGDFGAPPDNNPPLHNFFQFLSGFHWLQTCCHSFGPANILCFFFQVWANVFFIVMTTGQELGH